MHLVCPHCHNPIEIVTASGNEDVLCPSCGSTFRLDTESTANWGTLRGRQLGRFELIESVGVGAFGTVYKARDPHLDRVVAIKIPRAGNLASKEDLDRFLREGRSVARLVHPTIVPVHEVGLADGVPYLVSEFVEGLSLSDLLTSRQLAPRDSAELVATVADLRDPQGSNPLGAPGPELRTKHGIGYGVRRPGCSRSVDVAGVAALPS